jgi:hypothetical protein
VHHRRRVLDRKAAIAYAHNVPDYMPDDDRSWQVLRRELERVDEHTRVVASSTWE